MDKNSQQNMIESNIKLLITPEIIEEHQRQPIGQHSPDLSQILIYLRRNHPKLKQKYIIVCTRPHQQWCIAKLSGRRGVPPSLCEDACFVSEAAAEHGVFVRQLQDLGLL